ncbi:MAG: helix-turn-helix transcriptional regulator [Solirubrobacterales bacterium]|nr:helix-turn-helix transcriptional regulator [Solirubrobacterales bacterium]
MGSDSLLFGPFRLIPKQRLLLEGGRPVRLGSRALDILIALAERQGDLVSKDELIRRVWPGTFVEEGNLKVQVRVLRQALGDGQADRRYIANVPGRGYSLLAPVSRADAKRPATSEPTSTPPHNLPSRLTRLVGRANVTERLVAQVSSQRLTSIIGPGGIGKTALALAVAEELLFGFPHGVWLVELAPVADPSLVPTALASLFQVDASPEALAAALRDKKTLILLDNCEHVIDAVASLVTALLAKTRGLHIIATSREPLRAVGERTHRLAALSSPPGPSPPGPSPPWPQSPRLDRSRRPGSPAILCRRTVHPARGSRRQWFRAQ